MFDECFWIGKTETRESICRLIVNTLYMLGGQSKNMHRIDIVLIKGTYNIVKLS